MSTTAMSAIDPAPASLDLAGSSQAAKSAHHRRKREELEALAADFVNSQLVSRAPPPRKLPLPAVAGAGILAAVLLAWLLWPQSGDVQPEARAAAPAAQAEDWAKRLEAERERKRKELGSSEYMTKMAAADSALLRDMGSHATALTQVPESPADPEPAPVPARKVAAKSGEPTPRSADPAPRAQTAAASPASSGPAPAPAPAPVEQRAEVKPAPAAPASEPAKEPAKAETAPPELVAVAAAEPAQCRLHVSSLSSSGTLTYADITKMKGARTDSRGHVFTPVVNLEDGRRVVFEVMPTGCVNWRRAS